MVKYPRRKSAILPALTVAYRQVGHLSEQIYREISEIIEVPYIEIAEAASFYTMFPKEPVGKYLIQVCHNISCALLGADSLVGYLEQKLGIKKGETTPDNLFTLISVECLGSCATAPMMQINDKYYENLTREKVDTILEELRRQG
jgi:NADH-quinone oxidoreductase E subunit